MRETGYYWCLLKFRNKEEWDILWYSSQNDWILDGEIFNSDESCKIIEIDEKQIKRNNG